jgi:hypothetical protein
MDDDRECEKANESDEAEGGDDLEAQVAKELAAIKRPRKEQRFGGWVSVSEVFYAQG